MLSRRPLADRQRILKDSRVGAFAVISLGFMMLLFFASMATLAEDFTLAKAAMLCAVFTISRELSAYSIINRTPMQTSQYRGLSSTSARCAHPPGKSPLLPVFERGSSQCRAQSSWIAFTGS